VQHRRKQKEVVAVHERDLDVGIPRQRVIQVNCRMQPGKNRPESESEFSFAKPQNFLREFRDCNLTTKVPPPRRTL
jgi:hypothetical protein